MAVISFVACNICGENIDVGTTLVVIYEGGTFSHIKDGKAIITFADEESAKPIHQHGECHEATHGTPLNSQNLIH